jgi:hypothetical protein
VAKGWVAEGWVGVVRVAEGWEEVVRVVVGRAGAGWVGVVRAEGGWEEMEEVERVVAAVAVVVRVEGEKERAEVAKEEEAAAWGQQEAPCLVHPLCSLLYRCQEVIRAHPGLWGVVGGSCCWKGAAALGCDCTT